jgi:hypothetical protein
MVNIDRIITEEIEKAINKNYVLEYLDKMTSDAMRSLGTQDKPSDLANRTYRYLRKDTWYPKASETGLQKNDWLVHITDLATGYKIMKEGFKSSIRDLDFRATQDLDTTEEMTKNGLCFAHELTRDDDWVDYVEDDMCAIVFQANGFNAFSSFGDIYEVVFNANSAHNLLMILPMNKEEEEKYLRYNSVPMEYFKGVKIVDKNGKILRYCNAYDYFGVKNGFKVKSADNPSSAEEWLNNASIQYRKHFSGVK